MKILRFKTMTVLLGLILAHTLLSAPSIAANPHDIFADGFESGDIGNWNDQAGAKVEWEPAELDASILQGTQMSTVLVFVAGANLGLAQVVVVPGLQDFVSVSPSWPIEVFSGESVRVTVSISADFSDNPRHHGGVIQVRDASGNSNRVYPRPLPVSITVMEGQEVRGADYSIVIPSGWTTADPSDSDGYLKLYPPGREDGAPPGYIGDIAIRRLPNPGQAPLEVFYQNTAQLNLYEVAGNSEPLQFEGVPEAALFHDVPGNFWSTVIAFRTGSAVFEIVDFYGQVSEDLLLQVASSIELN